MTKIIKKLGSAVIKQAPMEMETKMEDFIKAIENAEEDGVFDSYVADQDEIAKNETSARLLRLIEDCVDTYCAMYKNSSGGAFVNFEIKFNLTPLFEGNYMGKASCQLVKHEFGKKEVLAEKIFGFRTVDEMRKNDWGEILLVQIITELFGAMHMLSHIKAGVKHSDVVNEKMRQANLKKKDEKSN